MRIVYGLAIGLMLSVAAVPVAPAKAAGRSCAMIRGHGIGVTDGIARWMANKAVTDSAKKWASDGRHSLTPVKISCSGFSCSGAAKACRG